MGEDGVFIHVHTCHPIFCEITVLSPQGAVHAGFQDAGQHTVHIRHVWAYSDTQGYSICCTQAVRTHLAGMGVLGYRNEDGDTLQGGTVGLRVVWDKVWDKVWTQWVKV